MNLPNNYFDDKFKTPNFKSLLCFADWLRFQNVKAKIEGNFVAKQCIYKRLGWLLWLMRSWWIKNCNLISLGSGTIIYSYHQNILPSSKTRISNAFTLSLRQNTGKTRIKTNNIITWLAFTTITLVTNLLILVIMKFESYSCQKSENRTAI